MLDTIMDSIFHGLLIGSSGVAMIAVNPLKHPLAFTASVVGLCHGCTSLYARFFDKSCGSEDSPNKHMNSAKKLTTSCLEIVTVPLVNMDLYISSQHSTALALGHGLFIIPLAFDLTVKFFANEEENEEECTNILKDLTVLGNIVSLLFFAVNENNVPAGLMAFSALFTYYGSALMENVLSGTGENASLAGYSLFFGLLPLATRELNSN